MATPTSRLKLKKQTLGSNLNQWGLSGGLNGVFDQVDVLAGYLEVNLGSATSYTFGTTNYATTGNEHMYRAVKFSGSPASGVTVNIPAVDDFKFVENATGQTITFSNGATTATLANTFTGYIRTNGSSVITVLTLPDGVNVKTVADNIANVNTTATNISNVNTVAGISANVTTTAGIAGNVTTVAGIASDVTGVAGISSAVSGVNAIASDVTAVNTDPLKTNIGNVSGNATNINAVAGNATNINTVAGINTNVTTVAGISSDVTGVNAVASDVTGVNAIASNVTTVAGVASNVTTVAGISGDVTGVNAISSAVTGVNTISAAVSSVNSNATNINAVAGNSTNINAVNSNATNINTVAGISADVTTTAGVATAVTAYSKQYSSGNGDISTRADGTGTVAEGDLRFRTDTDTMRVYNGTAWEDAAPGASNYYTKSDSDTRYAQVSNNLSDVTPTTARTNLGLDPLLAAKAPLASPTFTGTLASPTINASTALQIGGVAISASAAELNYNDVATLGTTEASKTVTADANGVVTFDNGKIEESTAITSSSNAATINLRDGDNFTHTLSENVTYTFSNPAANGKVSAFTLKVTQDSTARTITWPTSVDWAAATAPTLSTDSGAIDVFVFTTYDGGTTYYGFTAGQAMG